jgi:hypothetical protein
MKRMVFLSLALCFLASFVYAQEPATQATVTLKGTIIDNLSASSQKPEDLANFITTYTKQSALMPQCAASGYSLFADGKLSKFDKDSNAKIEEFLKKPDSMLNVTVVLKQAGNELSLVSIENQKESN